jgi:sterol 24-C-methyltransferase
MTDTSRSEKVRVRDLIQTSLPSERVQSVVDRYQSLHEDSVDARKANYETLVNSYYDLVTDFIEFGWGQSFHFAARHRDESMPASIARHQFYLAHVLGLKPGMRVLDVGSGIGGPMRAITRFCGATIQGINNNAYQIARAIKHDRALGFAGRCSYLKADFMNIPVPDASYDAAYAFEATCHAPDRAKLFAEIFRVMKDGAEFASYEWCLTPKYDDANPEHRAIKKGIEIGDGLPDLWSEQHVVDALKSVGFEVVFTRDMAATCDPQTPWWLPLTGQGMTSSFKSTPAGAWLTRQAVAALEAIKVAPKGSTEVSKFLWKGAVELVRGGKAGIFTPMFFFHVRKPGLK